MQMFNKSIERDAGIAVVFFQSFVCAPAPLMHVVRQTILKTDDQII
jgi:hypothetical protein